eukprot:3917708-Rhodomonas_salina.3
MPLLLLVRQSVRTKSRTGSSVVRTPPGPVPAGYNEATRPAARPGSGLAKNSYVPAGAGGYPQLRAAARPGAGGMNLNTAGVSLRKLSGISSLHWQVQLSLMVRLGDRGCQCQ